MPSEKPGAGDLRTGTGVQKWSSGIRHVPGYRRPLVPHTINTAPPGPWALGLPAPTSPSDSVDGEQQTGGDSGHISLCCTKRASLTWVAHVFDGFISASNSGVPRTTTTTRNEPSSWTMPSCQFRCVWSVVRLPRAAATGPRPMDPCGLGEA